MNIAIGKKRNSDGGMSRPIPERLRDFVCSGGSNCHNTETQTCLPTLHRRPPSFIRGASLPSAIRIYSMNIACPGHFGTARKTV